MQEEIAESFDITQPAVGNIIDNIKKRQMSQIYKEWNLSSKDEGICVSRETNRTTFKRNYAIVCRQTFQKMANHQTIMDKTCQHGCGKDAISIEVKDANS